MTTILIVDDNEQDQLLYRRTLHNEPDWTIVQAFGVREGLAALQTSAPDVVLLDYMMPDGTGLDFLYRMGDMRKAPPVIMFAGSGDIYVAVEAMKAGATDYFIKDVEGGYLTLLRWVILRVLKERDVRRASASAEAQVRLAANVLLNITEGIVVTNPVGTIVSVNPAYCEITGYASDELVGITPRIVKSGRHEHTFYAEMWRSIEESGYWRGEIWNRHKSGKGYLVRETITAVRDNSGVLTHYIGVLTDITLDRESEDVIRHRAYHDVLTGLPNRALLIDRAKHHLAHARRLQKSIAILFIDLDGFKAVNDNLGHHAGDELLRTVAERFQACLRESDTLARLGGDEFVAILNDLQSPDDVSCVAGKVLETLTEAIMLQEGAARVSASIGVAMYPEHGDDVTQLLEGADRAMYRAKRNGKAAIVFATASASGAED